MNDIIKIIKSLEVSNVLIDDITETVKHEIKNQEGRFLPALLAHLAASLVQLVISSAVKVYVEEKLEEQGKDTWIKSMSSTSSFKQDRDY